MQDFVRAKMYAVNKEFLKLQEEFPFLRGFQVIGQIGFCKNILNDDFDEDIRESWSEKQKKEYDLWTELTNYTNSKVWQLTYDSNVQDFTPYSKDLLKVNTFNSWRTGLSDNCDFHLASYLKSLVLMNQSITFKDLQKCTIEDFYPFVFVTVNFDEPEIVGFRNYKGDSFSETEILLLERQNLHDKNFEWTKENVEKKQNKFKKWSKDFFSKKENIGIIFMLVALLMFCSFSKKTIPGFRFAWQAKKLSLQFSLQTGILSLIFQAILYLRGIYDIGFDLQEKDERIKIFEGILKFIINTAIFTTFFAILFVPTGNTKDVFGVFFDLLKGIGIGGGILCGIILFGSKNTASIASFIIVIVFLSNCIKNINLVSRAAGFIGWFYIVFVCIGFLLQENIKLTQLASDFINLFSFGKKMAVVAGESTDRCVENGKQIAMNAMSNGTVKTKDMAALK